MSTRFPSFSSEITASAQRVPRAAFKSVAGIVPERKPEQQWVRPASHVEGEPRGMRTPKVNSPKLSQRKEFTVPGWGLCPSCDREVKIPVSSWSPVGLISGIRSEAPEDFYTKI